MKISQRDIAIDDLDIRRENEFSGASKIVLLSTALFLSAGRVGLVWHIR